MSRGHSIRPCRIIVYVLSLVISTGFNAMFLSLRVFGHIMELKKSTGSIQIALFQIMGAVLAIFGQFLAAILAFSLAITKVYMDEVPFTAGTNATSHG